MRATLTFDAARQGSVTLQLQWDMYPAWIDVARVESERAKAARLANPGPDGDADFVESLYLEMKHSMMCISAVAFALEAFSNSVRVNYASVGAPRAKRSAAARVQETLTSAFRVPNHLSKNMRATMRDVFDIRNRAVHPPIGFVDPVMHPDWPIAVEPSFARFSSANAATALTALERLLPYLLANPRPGSEDWSLWCAGALIRLKQSQGAYI
jgi:hypothetical protein